MDLDELKKKFIVDGDIIRARLEPIVEKASEHCVVDRNGRVHINERGLPGRAQVMLVLSARAIAAQLDPNISAEVTVADVQASTGLPADQIRARGKELVDRKLAISPSRGTYQAVFHKVESFLDELSQGYSKDS